MGALKPAAIARDWFAKILAGTLLGFTLALACSALFARLASGMALAARGQLAMWMLAPIWLGVLASVFFFRSGKHAWLGLGSANLLVLGLLALSRYL